MGIIGLHESETVEFKESLSELEAGGETLCGCTNQNGGDVYFGIKNNGEIIGIQSVTEKTLRDVTQFLFDNIEPKRVFNVKKEIKKGHEIIKISVDKSSTPYHTFKGKPYIRIGPSTRSMPQEEYQQRLIMYKSVNKDYTATLIPEVRIKDLSQDAVRELRRMLTQSGRYKVGINSLSDEQLLKDLLLMKNGQLTLAALILLGTEETLSMYLPHAEIRFGYKLNEGDSYNQDIVIFKGGYLLYYNTVWEKIQARNLIVNIPLGMRLVERRAFDEQTIREAVSNAIIHRDYGAPESIFLFQYQTKVVIKSPGGLPEGVTVENIINESRPRNKLLADILFKCELVEQFGSGVNLMYKNQLSLGKNPPDYQRTTADRVTIVIDGMIQDIEFAKYVLRIGESKNKILDDEELIVLIKIKNKNKVKLSNIIDNLLELGLIENISYGKYMLSKQYYSDTNQRAQYTRRRGLSRSKNKELILEHLRNFGSGKKRDFAEIFNFELTEKQISNLLEELREEGKIHFEGIQRSSRGAWKLKQE